MMFLRCSRPPGSGPATTRGSSQLRKGVKFHNGEPFNANAAAYSINRILNPKNKSQLTSFVATIKSVKAASQYSLRVTTKGPTRTSRASSTT